jgi:hypothetical protein
MQKYRERLPFLLVAVGVLLFIVLSTTDLYLLDQTHETNALISFHSLVLGRDNAEIQKEGKRLLDAYPNSFMRREVADKMAQSQKITDEVEATKLWTQINDLPIENNDEIQTLGRQYLDKFLTGKHRREVIVLMNEAQQLHDESIVLRDWKALEWTVRAAVEEGNIPSALSILVRRERKDAQWTALCESILSKTTETVRRRIDNFGMQFDTITNEIKRSQEAVRLLSSRGIAQADEVLHELNPLLSEIETKADKWYYERVQNRRTRVACDDYLDNAPKQTMRQYVTNYLQYIDQMEGNLNLTVRVALSSAGSTKWGGSSCNEFRLFVNGVQKITIDDLNLMGFNSNRPMEFANNSLLIGGKLTDTINIKVEMLYDDRHGRDQRSCDKTFTIGVLLQGQLIPLVSKNFSFSDRHSLVLFVTGAPQEPPLPEWRPRP